MRACSRVEPKINPIIISKKEYNPKHETASWNSQIITLSLLRGISK